MKRKKTDTQHNPFSLTDEQTACKSPANVSHVHNLYTYARLSGLMNDDDEAASIERLINVVRLREDELPSEELSALMWGFGNQATINYLKSVSYYLDNNSTVEDAILFISEELRTNRQLLIENQYVKYYPARENERPFDTYVWAQIKIDWYESELKFFKEFKTLGKTSSHRPIDNDIHIKLSLDKVKKEAAIILMFDLLNNRLIRSTIKEFKCLFGLGKQTFKKVEWIGSQAEIKAFVDLLRNNSIIENQNLNQLAEHCFYSSKHKIIARTLGAVTAQNTYSLLAKEQNQSHILYDLVVGLNALK